MCIIGVPKENSGFEHRSKTVTEEDFPEVKEDLVPQITEFIFSFDPE